MKPLLLALAMAFVFTSLLATRLLAQANANGAAAAKEEDWTTTDGTIYQSVKVVRVEDDAVTILYKDGGALVFLNKLPPALQERFDYDPVRAQAAAKARAAADAENAKLLQDEIAKAEAIKRKQQIDDAAKMSTNAPPK